MDTDEHSKGRRATRWYTEVVYYDKHSHVFGLSTPGPTLRSGRRFEPSSVAKVEGSTPLGTIGFERLLFAFLWARVWAMASWQHTLSVVATSRRLCNGLDRRASVLLEEVLEDIWRRQ
ncbi:unnamed protein product [Zymoseptoria tritici ST99CH_3D7]|uniref:Uncharacterized protein n=1 Tax=Zymoseptoria tritici (strain ST99CH_3D7) TaxID=1276538 RepID=A0A1X7RQK5_ZYMT9|nr:unnamed protein product [Zymoseptoria tritici ST99CH_3D7]